MRFSKDLFNPIAKKKEILSQSKDENYFKIFLQNLRYYFKLQKSKKKFI